MTNPQSASQSHIDVLAKMDALLNKHHDALARGSVMEDFPVLTEIVEEVEEAIPLLTEVVEIEMDPVAFATFEPVPEVSPLVEQEILPLSSEALGLLERQIRVALEQQLPSHIVAAVDKALPVVFEEFALQLEAMVRDAVAQELKQQLAELLRQNKL